MHQIHNLKKQRAESVDPCFLVTPLGVSLWPEHLQDMKCFYRGGSPSPGRMCDGNSSFMMRDGRGRGLEPLGSVLGCLPRVSLMGRRLCGLHRQPGAMGRGSDETHSLPCLYYVLMVSLGFSRPQFLHL